MVINLSKFYFFISFLITSSSSLLLIECFRHAERNLAIFHLDFQDVTEILGEPIRLNQLISAQNTSVRMFYGANCFKI